MANFIDTDADDLYDYLRANGPTTFFDLNIGLGWQDDFRLIAAIGVLIGSSPPAITEEYGEECGSYRIAEDGDYPDGYVPVGAFF